MSNSFEPKILAYCCQWCSYAAADLAGNMRMQYPHNVRIIRVPCTGRVDTLHLLRAFYDGADGVFVSGCLLDDCHYLKGNFKCAKKVEATKKTLQEIGIEPERVEMFYNSSAMGPQFAQTCKDFTATIQALGPLFKEQDSGAEDQEPDQQASAVGA